MSNTPSSRRSPTFIDFVRTSEFWHAAALWIAVAAACVMLSHSSVF